MPTLSETPRPLGLSHMAATGAAVALFLLVVLWAGAALGVLRGVLTVSARTWSSTDLVIAAAYALAVGGAIGLVIAVCYNVFRFLGAVRSVEDV